MLYNKNKKMRMHIDTKTGVLIVVAAAFLVVIFIVAFVATSNPSGISGGKSGAGPTSLPVYAPQGQVIGGFPKELILDPGARASNSYSINYSSASNQYTTEWNSSLSLQTLYANYQDYFSKNGWTIVNTATAEPTFRGLYAKSGVKEVNLILGTQGKGTHVTLTYLQK